MFIDGVLHFVNSHTATATMISACGENADALINMHLNAPQIELAVQFAEANVDPTVGLKNHAAFPEDRDVVYLGDRASTYTCELFKVLLVW